MRRNSSSGSINSQNNRCSICFDTYNKYYILCACSDQPVCRLCIHNLENHNNYKCPFCRRDLQFSNVVDYKRRLKFFLYILVWFLLIILSQVVYPIILVYFYGSSDLYENKTNNPDLVYYLLPTCVLIIQPTNYIFHYYCTGIPLNDNTYRYYTIGIIIYSIIFSTIFLFVADKNLPQFFFMFLVIPIYLTPFFIAIVCFAYTFLGYYRNCLDIKYYSYKRISVINTIDNRIIRLRSRRENQNNNINVRDSTIYVGEPNRRSGSDLSITRTSLSNTSSSTNSTTSSENLTPDFRDVSPNVPGLSRESQYMLTSPDTINNFNQVLNIPSIDNTRV